MSKFLSKTQQRQSVIRKVLLNEWDPIGVSQFAEAPDEYDGYVAEIDALVARKASQEEIFTHLWKIETDVMGLTGNRRRTEFIAKKLFELA